MFHLNYDSKLAILPHSDLLVQFNHFFYACYEEKDCPCIRGGAR